MRKQFERSFLFHAAGLLCVLLVLSIFSSYLAAEGLAPNFDTIYFLIALSGLGHFLTVLKGEVDETSFFLFLLVDIPISYLVVRESGFSSSPFLVLYPLLALGGAISLRFYWALGYLLFVLVAQVFSIGFGVSIIGNWLATLSICALGIYLVNKLQESDEALEASEGQRRRLENLQRAILANIPSGLVSVDSQGQIIQINSVGLKILGVAENEVLMKSLKAMLPEISDQVLRLNTLFPSINQFSMEGERPTIGYKNPLGDHLRLGYSVARLLDPKDNSVLGSLVVFQDLTRIVRMEEDLRMSEKLAAVGKLAAGIAHEIRNPLAGISGSAQLLSSSEVISDEDKKLLQIIQRESTRLDGLITEFLEYVRPAKAKMEPVNLLKIAEHVAEQMRAHSKWKGTRAELSIKNLTDPKGEVFALGDENKITQVLINLLLNAAQAGSQKIEILISDTPPRIEIVDDGAGISPENQKHVFEPFFTTKESGTGLGLAVSYRVLEAMEAKIEVRSPVVAGRGTAFKLNFKKNLAA